MADRASMSRRMLLAGAPAAALMAGADPGRAAQPVPGGGSALVAYFSRTGNTALVARQVARARSADLFEFRPAEPYPEDYGATVARAERERASGLEPQLAETVGAIDRYDTVFLGFPVWGTTAPAIVRSFLRRHDLADKTLVPLITHGGYGPGSARDVVAANAPGARLVPGFTMEGEQERRVLQRVADWLGELRTVP